MVDSLSRALVHPAASYSSRGSSWQFHSFRPYRSNIVSAMELIRAGEFMDGKSDSARLVAANGRSPLYPDLPELAALRYVYARTRENDCVYVGVPRHAAVFVGDIRAYWLLHRCIGVHKFILEPGLTTTAAAQTEMAGQLKQNRVRWLVLTPPEKGDDAFLRSPMPGCDVLDAAIALHYRIAATFGPYSVLAATDF